MNNFKYLAIIEKRKKNYINIQVSNMAEKYTTWSRFPRKDAQHFHKCSRKKQKGKNT